jgi:hypothetical protein
MEDYFKKLFNRENNDQQQIITVVSMSDGPVLYERKKPQDLELINRHENELIKTQRELQQKETQSQNYLKKAKDALRYIRSHQLPKESIEAKKYQKEAQTAMSAHKSAESECSRLRQIIDTLQIKTTNLKHVDKVKRMRELDDEYNKFMQESVKEIGDIGLIQETASETKQLSKDMDQISKYVMNPYRIDQDEVDESIATALDELVLTEEEEEQEVKMPTHDVIIQKQPALQKNNIGSTTVKRNLFLLEDDL